MQTSTASPAATLLPEADLADDVAAAIAAPNHHVLLPAVLHASVLDGMAARLAAGAARVVRISAQGHMTLGELLLRLVATADRQDGVPSLEAAHDVLTDPGPGRDRVVLLLDGADALDTAALRYLRLAARDTPLRLVFAAGPGFASLLAPMEFASLRRELHPMGTPAHSAEPILPAAPTPAIPPVPKLRAPECPAPGSLETGVPAPRSPSRPVPGAEPLAGPSPADAEAGDTSSSATIRPWSARRRWWASLIMVLLVAVAGVLVWLAETGRLPAIFAWLRAFSLPNLARLAFSG